MLAQNTAAVNSTATASLANRAAVLNLVAEISTFALSLINAAHNPATKPALAAWYAGEAANVTAWLASLPANVSADSLRKAWLEYDAAAKVEEDILLAA